MNALVAAQLERRLFHDVMGTAGCAIGCRVHRAMELSIYRPRRAIQYTGLTHVCPL